MNKLKAIGLSLLFLSILAIKGTYALVAYPFVYPFYEWASVNRDTQLGRFLWMHFDEEQPTYGPDWYYGDISTWYGKFYWSYKWSALRNPMYNINYYYLSNYADVTKCTKVWGNYDCTRKLRRRKGDLGTQFVWYITEHGETRFLFSLAQIWFGVDVTVYFGWNVSHDGRFTVAGKLRNT